MKTRLIVFSRFPAPGKTKTRLIPAIGPIGAAHLHKRLAENTVKLAGSFSRGPNVDLEVRYTGGSERQMRRWLGPKIHYAAQGVGDLGTRMQRAFHEAFHSGYGKAILIGTDCPDITSAHLTGAVAALAANDVVFGPSCDGGYWLVGLTQPTNIFHGITWGSGSVLQQSQALARENGLALGLLDMLSDIDVPQDLAQLAPDHTTRPYISVVIPALNEADNIERAISSARHENTEIIVVDGRSTDETVKRATTLGVKVVSSLPGRARQMNCGAALARGEIIVFLHADTALPENYASLIFHQLIDRHAVGGAFKFKSDWANRKMSIIAWLINIRSKYLQLPYGDQAMFVKQHTFEKIGGFAQIEIAEDLQFIRKLRKHGPIAIIDAPAVSSARRYARAGCLRTTAINQAVVWAYFMGVPPKQLARIYQWD